MTPDELEAAIKRRSALIALAHKLDKVMTQWEDEGIVTPEECARNRALRRRFADKYGKGPA